MIRNSYTYLISILSLMFYLCFVSYSCQSTSNSFRSIQNTKEIKIQYFSDDISIDGIFDEEVYKDLDKYYLINSQTGQAVKNLNYQSYFTVHHDKRTLFISMTSFDQYIHSEYKNRDDHLWKEECIEIFIDTDDNPQDYIEIELSPAGVLFDSFIVNPDKIDVEKTAKFNLKTIRSEVSVVGSLNDPTDIDVKWNAELSIDLYELDKDFNHDSAVWRMNIYRINQDEKVDTYFAYSPTYGKFHQPDKFVDCSFKKK